MDEDSGEYVLNFDQIDFDSFEFGEIKSLGQAYEAEIHPVTDEDESCHICFPAFKVDEDGVPIDCESGKRNAQLVFTLDSDNTEHTELAEWFEGFDNWVIESIIKNHPRWFGHLWKTGEKMAGKPKPPPEVLASMYERNFDGVAFSLRVPVRKDKPFIECFDIEQTSIPFESIKNCDVIPVVEFKSVRLYSRKSVCDLVLRGLCAQCSYEEMGVEYKICPEPTHQEYSDDDDYGTSDEDDEDEDDEQDDDQEGEQEDQEGEQEENNEKGCGEVESSEDIQNGEKKEDTVQVQEGDQEDGEDGEDEEEDEEDGEEDDQEEEIPGGMEEIIMPPGVETVTIN